MKDYIKKHKILSIILLILFIILFIILLILPFIVNFNSKESSTDYVNYYGMILTSVFSSIVTITIFYFTLNENRRQLEKEREFTKELTEQERQNKLKQAQKDRKLALLPFLSTKYSTCYDIESFINNNNNNNVYIIYNITPHKPIYSTLETPTFFKIDENINALNYKKKLYKDMLQTHYIFYYDITNAGSGNAINILFKINNQVALPKFSLSKNETVSYKIIIKWDKGYKYDAGVPFDFHLEFNDVTCENKYYQEQPMRLCILNNEEKRNNIIYDEISNPKEIKAP